MCTCFMTFLYREVLSATRLLPAEASSRRIRAIYLEHRLAATIDEKSLGVVVSNGNKRARAGCAFHSGLRVQSAKRGVKEREREEERNRIELRLTELVCLWKREREREINSSVQHRHRPPFVSFAPRSILSGPSDKTIYLAKMSAKARCYVHSRE